MFVCALKKRKCIFLFEWAKAEMAFAKGTLRCSLAATSVAATSVAGRFLQKPTQCCPANLAGQHCLISNLLD